MKKNTPAPEVSILVPVYRVEKTIDQCVRSIVRQTFGDWELILVDDRSPAPDRSSEKIAAWARRDPRIRIVTHDANRGLSQARFTGIGAARGRYLMFVDSDDWIPPRAVELLHRRIEAEEADMAIGSMVKVIDRWGIIKTRPQNAQTAHPRTDTVTLPELYDTYYLNYFGVNMFAPSMCGKIYRRSAIDRAPLKPSRIFYGEDMMFNIVLHPYLTKIAFVPDTVYFYRVSGETGTSTPRLLADTKENYLAKQRQIARWDYRKAESHIVAEVVENFYIHFRNLAMLDGLDFEEVGRRVREELDDGFWAGGLLLDGAGNDPRTMALRRRDIEAIMTAVHADVKRTAPRHRLVKAVSKLLV